jgi:hypothetical protein
VCRVLGVRARSLGVRRSLVLVAGAGRTRQSGSDSRSRRSRRRCRGAGLRSSVVGRPSSAGIVPSVVDGAPDGVVLRTGRRISPPIMSWPRPTAGRRTVPSWCCAGRATPGRTRRSAAEVVGPEARRSAGDGLRGRGSGSEAGGVAGPISNGVRSNGRSSSACAARHPGEYPERTNHAWP